MDGKIIIKTFFKISSNNLPPSTGHPRLTWEYKCTVLLLLWRPSGGALWQRLLVVVIFNKVGIKVLHSVSEPAIRGFCQNHSLSRQTQDYNLENSSVWVAAMTGGSEEFKLKWFFSVPTYHPSSRDIKVSQIWCSKWSEILTLNILKVRLGMSELQT